jgi:nitroreductase
MDVISAIHSRSSYRGKYDDTPVSREHLRLIVEAGIAAPSGCNKQSCSFIAIDEQPLLKNIHQLLEPPVIDRPPAMICVLTQRIIAYRNVSFFVQDYSAAIENMLLTIVALGYQSCWIEGHITDSDDIGRKIADQLGVPDDFSLVCLLPVGRALEPIKRVEKKAFEQRAWFNFFAMHGSTANE